MSGNKLFSDDFVCCQGIFVSMIFCFFNGEVRAINQSINQNTFI